MFLLPCFDIPYEKSSGSNRRLSKRCSLCPCDGGFSRGIWGFLLSVSPLSLLGNQPRLCIFDRSRFPRLLWPGSQCSPLGFWTIVGRVRGLVFRVRADDRQVEVRPDAHYPVDRGRCTDHGRWPDHLDLRYLGLFATIVGGNLSNGFGRCGIGSGSFRSQARFRVHPR